MSEQVKVKSVSGGKPWNDLVFYDMVFERNGEGFACSWGKKSEGAPQVGEELEGEFYKDKRNEWKFRKASKSPGPSSGGKRDWQPESQRDPERSARILRQHSQGLAVQIALAGDLKALVNEAAGPGQGTVRLCKEFVDIIDLLDADVNKAGQAATQAQASPRSIEPPEIPKELRLQAQIAQNTLSESHWWFEDHLMKAGLDGTGAKRLATFILDRFDAEQGKRAEQGLSDFDTMGETLAKLETAFRTIEGENLPKDGNDMEDLPF